jgi:serine O-acetyltransferase
MGAVSDFLQDIDRYRLKPRSRLTVLFFNQGLWACAVYRLFRPLVVHRFKIVRRLAHVTSIFAKKWIEVFAGISLPAQCEIGPGLFISHFGGVVINPRTRVGRHCNLGHGITIGSGGRGEKNGHDREGVPVIGDRVYIGPGACLFGPLEIGNDVSVGANAVVIQSLPDRAVAVGVPARIVSFKGSFDYVHYLGMEDDAERIASLCLASSEPSPSSGGSNTTPFSGSSGESAVGTTSQGPQNT